MKKICCGSYYVWNYMQIVILMTNISHKIEILKVCQYFIVLCGCSSQLHLSTSNTQLFQFSLCFCNSCFVHFLVILVTICLYLSVFKV